MGSANTTLSNEKKNYFEASDTQHSSQMNNPTNLTMPHHNVKENPYIERCDLYTKSLIQLVKRYSEFDGSFPRPRPLDLSIFSKNKSRKTTERMGIKFIKKNYDSQTYLDQLFKILHEDQILNLMKEPIHDPYYFFGDPVVATLTLEELFSHSTSLLPRLSTRSMEGENIDSATHFTDFILGSFAQYFLRSIHEVHVKSPYLLPDEAVYAIDVSEYSKYPLRQGFAKYGTIAYLDASFHPCGIWHCEAQRIVFPGEPTYQHISLIFRSSIMLECLVYYNLFYIHVFMSNEVAITSEKCLSNTHPIRRLLRPHTFGSSRMNYTSFMTSTPYGSLLSRLTAFTEESWEAMLQDRKNRLKYEPFSKLFQQTGLSDDLKQSLPLYVDGLDYWNITETYVHRYLEIIYPTDQFLLSDHELQSFWNEITSINSSQFIHSTLSRETLIEYLSNFIFVVTGLYQLFGAVSDYPVVHFPLKVFEGQEEADIQTSILQTCLLALSVGKMPKLMNNWWAGKIFHGMFLPGQSLNEIDFIEVEKNHSEWQDSLRLLSQKIDQRNILDRNCPFHSMNPKFMECSISL